MAILQYFPVTRNKAKPCPGNSWTNIAQLHSRNCIVPPNSQRNIISKFVSDGQHDRIWPIGHSNLSAKRVYIVVLLTVVWKYIGTPQPNGAMAQRQRVWLKIRGLGVRICMASFANITHFDRGPFLMSAFLALPPRHSPTYNNLNKGRLSSEIIWINFSAEEVLQFAHIRLLFLGGLHWRLKNLNSMDMSIFFVH